MQLHVSFSIKIKQFFVKLLATAADHNNIKKMALLATHGPGIKTENFLLIKRLLLKKIPYNLLHTPFII